MRTRGRTAEDHLAPAAQKPIALPWWIAVVFAAGGGWALDIASPGISWWPAALLGASLIVAALWQQRAALGALVGLVAGASFWLPHIAWLTLYLGPIPWLALSSVMIAWFVVFGWAAALATRGLYLLWQRSRSASDAVTKLFLPFAQSITVAGLWVAREQLQSTWPYGGFAWGRLAHAGTESPLVPLVSWLGFAGFSGVLVLICALLVSACFAMKPLGRSKPMIGLATLIVAVVALAMVPVAPLQTSGTLTVAAVQGNSKSGIFDDRENGDVFRAHVDATRELLDELEAKNQQVDVIVWPENSAEFQLPEQTLRAHEIKRLAQRANAPIALGTVLHDEDGTFTNSTLVFDAAGATDLRYDKRRPVPFAEYMPNRPFFRALVPELVDLVQLDYAFGLRSAVLPIETPTGQILAGIAICFDIIFDDHAVAMMADEAQVIFAQTNNADFGQTDESAQQLQIAKLRAVETGRALVNISTVGTSAIVMPDGSVQRQLHTFTADSMVADVPLVSGHTPALRFGAIVAAAWMVVGAVGFFAGAYGARRLKPESLKT